MNPRRCVSLFVCALALAACRTSNAPATHLSIVIDPPTLDFGPLEPGLSKSLTVTITNNGEAVVHVSDVSISGDARTAFKLGTLPDVLKALAVSQEAKFTVAYTAPAIEGTDTAFIAIKSDAPARSQLVLTGQSLRSCGADLLDCAGTCVQFKSDTTNCGKCGKICDQGQSCIAGTCAAPTCADATRNGTETDVDCGGLCSPCANGKSCTAKSDCLSSVCTAAVCRVPTCTDGVRNGSETGLDCGGSCSPCPNGIGNCKVSSDCTSGLCAAGACGDKPTLSIDAVDQASEGGIITFNVTISAAIGADVSFAYATQDGTALAGSDYNARSGTGKIAAGQTSTTLGVITLATAGYQGDRTFTLALSAPVNATLGNAVATATVKETTARAPNISYATPVAYTVYTPIATNGPNNTGDAAVFSAPALPSGLFLDANSGFITGSPTAATPATDYTVTATNAGGSVNQKVNITVQNPAPTLGSLTPLSATAGTAGFLLTLNGTNFVSGAAVSWNSVARTASFVNPFQLTTQVSAQDIAQTGTASVTLTNPAPGGGTSGAAIFNIQGPSVVINTNQTVCASATYFNLTVAGGAVLTLCGGITITVQGTLAVTQGSTILVQGTNVDSVDGVGSTIIASTAQIGPGCSISADGQGYSEENGPGAGSAILTQWGAGGGGYGGAGAHAAANGGPGGVGGITYGSATNPTDLGSGGGCTHLDCNNNPGGAGGGAITLVVSGKLTNNGTVSAQGAAATGYTSGGGSGGALNVTVGTLSGVGSFVADGGAGNHECCGFGGGGGSGGGGRIFVSVTTHTNDSTTMSAKNGGQPIPGSDGTVVTK